eukprot:1148865-Pelagomonas_calceolata.AAC.3
MLMGAWRVTGSTQLQILAVKSVIVFNSTPSGNKLVGVQNRMDMKFASKFSGTLMAYSKAFKVKSFSFRQLPAQSGRMAKTSYFDAGSGLYSACYRLLFVVDSRLFKANVSPVP